jgi:hypothetical protein
MGDPIAKGYTPEGYPDTPDFRESAQKKLNEEEPARTQLKEHLKRVRQSLVKEVERVG